MNVAPVMVAQVCEVEGKADPEVEAGEPDQDGVLEALGEVWAVRVPCHIPVLGKTGKLRSSRAMHSATTSAQSRGSALQWIARIIARQQKLSSMCWKALSRPDPTGNTFGRAPNARFSAKVCIIVETQHLF